MAREVTQRQRAAQFYNSLLKGTGVLGYETPRGRFKRLQLLLAHDQQTRQEALREAKVIITQAATWTPQSVVAILDRLAREGVNE